MISWKQITQNPSALIPARNRAHLIGYLFNKSRYEAKRRGLLFLLTPSDYAQIWRDDCALCAVTFSNDDRWRSRSLDRVDAGGSYYNGNVRFVCFGCNANRGLADIITQRRTRSTKREVSL